MNTLDEIRALRTTALRLLPGFWQARAQMNMAIEVLEYFARDAEHELMTGRYKPPPIDPRVEGGVGVLQSMLNAFQSIHSRRE